jgi:hypothetical protein
MKSAVLASLVLCILVWPLACGAQTDYSLRIRSLDARFAGLLDDFLTDVYLDPARLAELDSSMVYASTLPAASRSGTFPTVSSYGWDRQWIEDEFMSGIGPDEPVALSYFGVLGGKTAFLVGVELGVDTREEWDDDVAAYAYADRAMVVSDRGGGYDDDQRYELDIAVAPVTTGNALGARIRGVIDDWSEAGRSVRDNLEWLYADASNPTRRYNSQYVERGSERLELGADVGYSRPSSLLRETVAGVVYLSESENSRYREYELYDNDPDNNGIGYGGYPPEAEYEEGEYRNGRDYEGLGGFLRCHLRWSEKLRSAHCASFSRSTGDGSASMEIENGGSGTWEAQGLAYDYGEGTLDRWFVQSSLGYHDVVAGRALFAIGLDARYTRTAFDESAAGTFTAESNVGLNYGAPYEQTHDNTDESIAVSLPVAMEWPFYKYLTFRIGSAVVAYRTKRDRVLTTNASGLLTGSETDVTAGMEFVDYDNVAEVYARFNTGLGFNLKDRFILEVATYSSYEVALANYYELSARFRV